MFQGTDDEELYVFFFVGYFLFHICMHRNLMHGFSVISKA